MHVNGIQPILPDAAVRIPVSLQSTTLKPPEFVQHAMTHIQSEPSDHSGQTTPLREAFNEFVGQTFFAELIKSYRSTQQPSAYFHGGRAEQIFQGQLDQVLTEALSQRTADTIADPMFELFMAKRL